MIKLKILQKRMKNGECLRFYSTREQLDNITKPFSKKPFDIVSEKVGNNKFLITISKS